MYKIIQKVWTAPNGQSKVFSYRPETNDENVIRSGFCEDEYGVLGLGLKPGDAVVDIGAHIGAVTLLLAASCPGLRIFSFEPILENFELLKKNVQANPYDGEFNIFNEAVWFYDGDEVRMYGGGESKGGKIHRFIGSQFLIADYLDEKKYAIAPTISLSAIFEENRIRDCQFLKIDCEGAEYGIFKGCPKEVLAMIERIHGEYHNIDPDRIKKPREMLLKQTKGVFKDETGQPEKGQVGPFVFIRK